MHSHTQAPASRSLLGDTRGLSTVEYVIILALVAIGGISVWRTFGQTLATEIGASSTEMGGIVHSARNGNGG